MEKNKRWTWDEAKDELIELAPKLPKNEESPVKIEKKEYIGQYL